MSDLSHPQDLLRNTRPADRDRVTFVELFFDLVFVFTIIQLSHTMASHYTLLGVAEMMVIVLAVWWVWIFTTWVTNWLDPDAMPVPLMLFTLMFLGMVLSTSIPYAYGERGLLFAGAYVGMQVGRSLFTLWVFWKRDHENFENFRRMTIWVAVSGVFWIAGGLVQQVEVRLGLWILALGIEYVSPAMGFHVPGLGRSTGADWNISGAHMAERCALFIIICLGETILVIGRRFGDVTITAPEFAAFAVAFLKSASLWWIYFRFGQTRAAHLMEHSDTPGEMGRTAFTYAHIPIVTGIIMAAVGTEFLLDHPLETAGYKAASALAGGPALFLLGNTWFKGLVSRQFALSHLAGLSCLGLLFLASPYLNLLTFGAATCATLLLVATWEFLSTEGEEEPEES